MLLKTLREDVLFTTPLFVLLCDILLYLTEYRDTMIIIRMVYRKGGTSDDRKINQFAQTEAGRVGA